MQNVYLGSLIVEAVHHVEVFTEARSIWSVLKGTRFLEVIGPILGPVAELKKLSYHHLEGLNLKNTLGSLKT